MQLEKQLEVLQEKLVRFEQMAVRVERVMTHANPSRGPGATTERQLEFPEVSANHLSDLGVEQGSLTINRDILVQRSKANIAYEDRIKLLCMKIKDIYRFTSMHFELGAKMIVDAVLLMVSGMPTEIGGTPVAVFPKMQIAAGGVSVVNPTTNFRVCLTGDISYGLCTNTQELWQNHATPDDVMKFAHSCVTLVTGRCEDEYLDDSMPEAISQAIALGEVAKKEAVRFCLSDGQNWIFSLLTRDKDGNRVCFQGEVFDIITPRPGIHKAFEEDVRRIVTLVYHWLFTNDNPFSDPLYTLEIVE